MSGAARTIGVVLEMIRPEFPDISVSKLRYLETEGLISPDRQQPSGYRRFSQQDIDRLLYVLRAQRDRYLPLKGSFTYAQLDDAEYRKLTPCSSCNPPIRKSEIDEINRKNGF